MSVFSGNNRVLFSELCYGMTFCRLKNNAAEVEWIVTTARYSKFPAVKKGMRIMSSMSNMIG